MPGTESGGRIHTSTARVAVLPEVEDVEIEIRKSRFKNRHVSFKWCRWSARKHN
ncbi:hypothetical protein ACVPOW_08485 [Staphylococcus aureus]